MAKPLGKGKVSSLLGLLEQLPDTDLPTFSPLAPKHGKFNALADEFNPHISEGDSSADEISGELKAFVAARNASQSTSSVRSFSSHASTIKQSNSSPRRRSRRSLRQAASADDGWVSAGPAVSTTESSPSRPSASYRANSTSKRNKFVASSSSEDAFGAAAAALAKESEAKRKAFRDSAASLTNDAFKQHLQVIRVKGKTTVDVPANLFQTWNSKIELNIALREWLIKDFPEDALTLTQITPRVIVPSDAVHLFVDYSNIYISFLGEIKRKLGISGHGSIPSRYKHFNLESFISLALRGRPAAKRVLGGSEGPNGPDFPADLATTFGFTVASETRARVVASSSSGKKHAETGVDSRLHAEILFSLLDENIPSVSKDGFPVGTIVCATGDGASDAYETTFPKVLLKALGRDRSVELLSWSKSLSSAFRKPDFNEYADRGRFKIILLDPYLDFMIDFQEKSVVAGPER